MVFEPVEKKRKKRTTQSLQIPVNGEEMPVFGGSGSKGLK